MIPKLLIVSILTFLQRERHGVILITLTLLKTVQQNEKINRINFANSQKYFFDPMADLLLTYLSLLPVAPAEAQRYSSPASPPLHEPSPAEIPITSPRHHTQTKWLRPPQGGWRCSVGRGRRSGKRGPAGDQGGGSGVSGLSSVPPARPRGSGWGQNSEPAPLSLLVGSSATVSHPEQGE